MDKKDYQEALEWLFKQTPNYQENGKKAYKPGLDNIKKLCDYWGNPQNKIKTIHIGGTNGKGSTSNMLASILQEAGYKVGIYNSPHLVEFTERVKINGEKADREFVYRFIQKLKPVLPVLIPLVIKTLDQSMTRSISLQLRGFDNLNRTVRTSQRVYRLSRTLHIGLTGLAILLIGWKIWTKINGL